MRADFPWMPVYTTLYFDADPAWHFKEAFGIDPKPHLIYPSAYYEDVLRKARILTIAPPPKLRPLQASALDEYLDLLSREISSSTPGSEVHEAIWELASNGLTAARSLTRIRFRPSF